MLRPLSPSVRDSLERATAQYQTHLDQALAYLEARGISRAIAEDFRLGVVQDAMAGHEKMVGRLAIPYLGRGNTVLDLRFRACGDVDKFKYLGLPGARHRMFNVRAFHSPGDTIHITEGELDAISLAACGFLAVGVPGANAWDGVKKPTHWPRLFAGFSTVWVWADGDEPGRESAERVAKQLDNAVVVNMPDGMDVNALLVQDGADAIRAMVGV